MQAKTFLGGYRFKRFKGQAKNELVSLSIPTRVIIPLAQGFSSPLHPLVKIGDRVYAGQIIARDDNNISSPVHSSINGKVVGIEKRNYFKREVTMVTIEGDGSKDYHKIEGYSPQWDKLSTQRIEELIYKSGVTCLDREGIPTHFKTSIIMPEDVENLIIHGASSEAYNSSLEVLLQGKNLFNFVEGVKILKKIMPQVNILLALDKEKRQLIERIKKLTVNVDKFNIYPVIPKYPQGYDEVLVPTLLNKKFPYGYSAANIGIVVLNIQAVLKVFEAVAEGKPLIERTIALCGNSFSESLHITVRVGTPLDFIIEGRLRNIPSRIVLNSLLTGFELNDLSLPVDKTFSQIIAIPENKQRRLFGFLRTGLHCDSHSRTFVSNFIKAKKIPDTNLNGEQRPCIQCGYCIEVCPVRIVPTLLDRYFKVGVNEILMRYGIFNCIDCNLCSYVCPSKIPLSSNLREARAKLIQIGCDNSLCILPRFNLKGLEEYKGVKTVR
jgi:Na(+)-translocating NADH:ubiquinone oxidoreductase A subunit